MTQDKTENFIAYTKNKELHEKQAVNAYNLAKKEYSFDITSNRYLETPNKIAKN